MARSDPPSASTLYSPGEVLALLTPLQEMKTGLYLVYSITDDWVVLRGLIDDEATENILVTDRESRVPSSLLRLFMPIGLRMPIRDLKTKFH